MNTTTFDLLVVGAGPAGAAAALGALGTDPSARVALVDRATFPRDKVCGDGLTPAAVDALHELGVQAVLDDTRPVGRFTVTGPAGTVLDTSLADPAYVMARRELDARLVAAALSRGAELLRSRVTDLTHAGDRIVVSGRWRARCVVGADGANSIVRRRLDLPRHPDNRTGVAVRGYAVVPPGPGRLEIRFVAGRLWPAYGWRFTGGDQVANIGVGTFDATTRATRRELHALLHRMFPDVEVDEITGHRLPLSSGPPALGVGRTLLAGDAAGLVDPLTGEGIQSALVSGMLAGIAAITHPAAPAAAYRRAIRRRLGPQLRHSRLAARAARRAGLIDAVIDAAHDDPTVADAIARLALSGGDLLAWYAVVASTLTHLPAAHRRHGRSTARSTDEAASTRST